MSSTLQASVFTEKNYSDNWHSITNTEDLTMKQMFNISEKLVSEQSDEVYGVDTSNWEDSSWKHLSLVGGEKWSVSRTQRFTYFQILHNALERWLSTQHQILFGKTDWRGSEVHQNTELWTELMVSQWNSSAIFPRIHHIAALQQSPRVLVEMSTEPEDFSGRIVFTSMFNDISWRSRENERECELIAQLVSMYAKRFSPGRWSFFRPGSEKKWCSTHEHKPQGEWDRVAEQMMMEFSESGHPVFRTKSIVTRNAQKQR